MAHRRKRRNMDGDIEDQIRSLIISDWSPPQISTLLEETLKKEGKDRWAPNVRTIQRMAKEEFVRDNSGNWSIADSEPEDARLVFDVLADGIANGYCFSFTKAEAKWIIRVKKTAPDAPNRIVFFLAFLYFASQEGGIIDVKAMDGYLTFTPWREDRKYVRLYKHAVAKNWVPQVPLWSILVEELIQRGKVDPRFNKSEDEIREFENDIYERSKFGKSKYSIETTANVYEMHPEDVEDIIRKYEKGGTK